MASPSSSVADAIELSPIDGGQFHFSIPDHLSRAQQQAMNM
jgi:hypothetical protein